VWYLQVVRLATPPLCIPPEVKEKLFSPFFTSKPAGEGTGLGLSISHDIIVKQHGKSIEVDTEPREFTEFRIVLPRTEPPQSSQDDLLTAAQSRNCPFEFPRNCCGAYVACSPNPKCRDVRDLVAVG
jgi:histidine kinase/DNA gyrase B/HSP90-like ATPase